MSHSVDTPSLQRAFVRFCCTGNDLQLPINQERAQIYRNRIYGNISKVLQKAYPIAFQALGQEAWDSLIDHFLATRAGRCPSVWMLPIELYEFVSESDYGREKGWFYLEELLYFEWIEIEVRMMSDIPPPPYRLEGSLLEDPLVINCEYRLSFFHYPVFKVPPAQIVDQKGAYWLFSYRDPQEGDVQCMELSAFFARIIELLGQEAYCGADLLEQVGQEMAILDKKRLLTEGAFFLEHLLQRRAILGFA